MHLLLVVAILLGSAEWSSSQVVQRNHTCDFESLLSCGWTVSNLSSEDEGVSGVAASQLRPAGGPSADAAGNQTGQYFYFSSSTLSQGERILRFPSYILVCGLSLSYYVSGPLDLGLLFENYDYQTLYMMSSSTDTTNPVWRRTTLSFNSSDPFDATLYLEVSPYDFGEAPVEPGGNDLFLGLDDISLTFCLPCDYDALAVEGSLALVGVSDLTIRLRVTSTENYDGSSSICPNQSLEYSIDSVEPPQVAGIFSLDPRTGVLQIQGQGPGLEPSGVQNGQLEISVYIPGSNYAHTSPPVRQYLTVSFTQPPTITHTAPSSLSVQVGTTFSYQLTVSSALGQTLTFGELTTYPQGLLEDLSIVINGTEATVSGLVSLSRDLPLILQNNSSPIISVPIMDIHGVAIASTQLVIVQSAPLFSQPHYEFEAFEERTGVMLGPIPIVDPNGDTVSLPEIEEEAEAKLFRVIFGLPVVSGIFTNVFLFADFRLDYEQFQEFDFFLTISDSGNSSLSSRTSVRVSVLPRNEFHPFFQTSDFSLDISDVEPRGHFVGEFVAQDHDEGADGDITYSITAGNNDGFFEFAVPSFGEVTVARSPILPHTYTLTITASDGGSPPFTASALLTVRVVATSDVDCTDPQFRPPMISSSSSRQIEVSVDSEVMFDCVYFANPAVRVYKWVYQNQDIILESSGRYIVSPQSLTVQNATIEDAGVYGCNITNQCGSQTIGYILDIIDYPDPPLNIEVISGPDFNSVVIIWDLPLVSSLPSSFVSRPRDSFEVWGRSTESEEYRILSTVGPNTLRVNVTGLYPGTFYWLVVASVNAAGQSLSNPINITTLRSVPKFDYFRASEWNNETILIEWNLLYNGGFPFRLQIQVYPQGAPQDIVYFVNSGYDTPGRHYQLPTGSLESGHLYIVMATLFNDLYSVEEYAYAYVGPKDNLFCDFESLDCFWQLDDGMRIVAENSLSPLVNVDSDSNQLGHFILAETSTDQETVIASYTKAWYVCGYSFSYQLSSNSELSLRTASGTVLWSSGRATSGWVNVTSSGEQFLTSHQEESLEYVLRGTGVVGIDNVGLQFCLPCDFPQLRSGGLHLTYPTDVELFLRTEQLLSISADLLDCSSTLLDFSIIRLVPGELESSFSLSQNSSQTVSINVGAIPMDRVLPHTPGYLEISVSAVHSDYHPDNSRIEKTVLIQFILLSATENCSLSRGCDFEGECEEWSVGGGVRLVTGAEAPVQALSSNQGTFLYGDYTSTTLPSSTVTSSRIGDTYCAVSFSYSTPSTAELVISVDDVGLIWTSLLATTNLEWSSEVVTIDLEFASLSSDRELVFSAGQSSEQAMDTLVPVYVALDNITLHPCIDCNAPVCVFTTCFPGRYFVLGDESCVTCPQGYYCPNWRDLPIPCPPGTFSNERNAVSSSVCKVCPDDSYSLTDGSTSCDTCPTGHSCVDPAHFPVANGQCSTVTPPMTTSATAIPMLTVIVGAAAGGVVLLLCLLLSCVLGCWCYKSKKETKKRKKNGRGRLLGEDMLSIGSAGSLGRSSMATSAFDSHGRRWKMGKDVSTLMSFLSDDDDRNNEASWEDTEQLTDNDHVTEGSDMTVFKNEAFEGADEVQLANLGNHGNYQATRSEAHHMSHF